jgi:hypothetical protein
MAQLRKEYRVVEGKNAQGLQIELNKVAGEGYELVKVVDHAGMIVAVLTKPVGA